MAILEIPFFEQPKRTSQWLKILDSTIKKSDSKQTFNILTDNLVDKISPAFPKNLPGYKNCLYLFWHLIFKPAPLKLWTHLLLYPSRRQPEQNGQFPGQGLWEIKFSLLTKLFPLQNLQTCQKVRQVLNFLLGCFSVLSKPPQNYIGR